MRCTTLVPCVCMGQPPLIICLLRYAWPPHTQHNRYVQHPYIDVLGRQVHSTARRARRALPRLLLRQARPQANRRSQPLETAKQHMQCPMNAWHGHARPRGSAGKAATQRRPVGSRPLLDGQAPLDDWLAPLRVSVCSCSSRPHFPAAKDHHSAPPDAPR